MSSNDLEQVVNHLEFLGYDVELHDKSRYAKHPSKCHFWFNVYSTGLQVSKYYRASDSAKKPENRERLLTFVNTANRQTHIVRFSIDEDADFWMIASYLGSYSKITFGQFLELWNDDHDTLLELDGLSEFLV